ncbi:hypothetical protein ABTZ59_31785 [Streptomyces sp. NPDC094034]|uniref:hypothetical protein n=1 Tax=Streptomyces sp. NPDC094034 TaxID=3155309 RepID=UPI003324ADFD
MRMLPVVLLAALVVVTVGCSSPGTSRERGEEKHVVSKISLQEAAEKADAIMLETMSSVQPALNWVHDGSTASGCGNYTIDGKQTGAVTRRVAVMTIVSEARRGSLLGVVERQWKKQGYEITGVDSDREFPAVDARTPEDFRMSVAVGDKGQFFFDVVTPCFIDSEVAPPKTTANGTPFEGAEVPYPSVHSDFWSANTPIPSPSS